MRLLLLLLLLLAAPLSADLITVKAVFDPPAAAPGSDVKLRLQFLVENGYHTYHKDNPGYGLKLDYKFTELAGLAPKGDAVWPTWHEWKDKDDPNWIEYELTGSFEIVQTFTVPAGAKDTLKLTGKFEGQACDDKACSPASGEFSAELKIDPAPAPGAELMSVTATLSAEGGRASPGGEVTLKLHFIVADTFHVYAKGNPGVGKPPSFEFTQLSGLVQQSEKWPEHSIEFPDEKDKTWMEWELKGQFDIVFTFTVPSTAKGTLSVAGKFNAQVCDADACQDKDGAFSAEIAVASDGAASLDTKALEEKVGALTDEVAALKKELADARKANEELSKTLKDYIKEQQEKAAASGAKDSHGFYEDYDYALAEARKQGKLLLIDFNGEY